jgi:hypothetical protein
MRSRLLALRAAAAAVIVMVAPVDAAAAAQAHGGVKVTISPSVVAPGGEVEIKVEGCQGDRAKVTSDAFSREAKAGGDSRSALHGDASIKGSAEPGSYDVDVRCDGRSHDGAGTVRVVQAAGSTPHDQNGHPTPYAPVQAGGGGTAVLATSGDHATAEASQSGPSPQYTVIGLILAGVAAVTVAFRTSERRRTASRNSD